MESGFWRCAGSHICEMNRKNKHIVIDYEIDALDSHDESPLWWSNPGMQCRQCPQCLHYDYRNFNLERNCKMWIVNECFYECNRLYALRGSDTRYLFWSFYSCASLSYLCWRTEKLNGPHTVQLIEICFFDCFFTIRSII